MPPDGFSIAILKRSASRELQPVGQLPISAEGADLRPGESHPPLQTYLVVPRPGAAEVTLRVSDGPAHAEARFAVGPPAGRVELSLEPPAPVKGRDTEAVLHVRVKLPDGRPDTSGSPPVLRANVGTLEPAQQVAPGEFKARYVLPTTRYPEVVVIAALEPWPHPQSVHGTFGRLLVPLAAAIELPGRSEPKAQFSIEIAKVNYGPVAAGADGKLKIPVVVPPGHRTGKATAVDQVGNRRTYSLDLQLPPTDQLSCVLNPARLPADGASRARVLCAACDVFGQPVPNAKVQLTAVRGTLSAPRQVEAGMLEWIYTAPQTLASEPDLLRAVYKQGKDVSKDELKVEIVQGPAVNVALTTADAFVHAGGRQAVELTATDAQDRRRLGATMEVSASAGKLDPVKNLGDGRWTTQWRAPKDALSAMAVISARAYGPQGTDPARIAAWIRGGHLIVGVTDLAGLPLSGQVLVVGQRAVVTGVDGSADVGAPTPGNVEIVHKQWPGLRLSAYVLDGAVEVFPFSAPVGEATTNKVIEIFPAVPINVQVKVDGRKVTYWVETVDGEVLAGRDVRVHLSAGSRSEGTTTEGRTTFTVTGSGPVTVSVADAATWVTAVAEVRP